MFKNNKTKLNVDGGYFMPIILNWLKCKVLFDAVLASASPVALML
jgi:hypothetical protein